MWIVSVNSIYSYDQFCLNENWLFFFVKMWLYNNSLLIGPCFWYWWRMTTSCSLHVQIWLYNNSYTRIAVFWEWWSNFALNPEGHQTLFIIHSDERTSNVLAYKDYKNFMLCQHETIIHAHSHHQGKTILERAIAQNLKIVYYQYLYHC